MSNNERWQYAEELEKPVIDWDEFCRQLKEVIDEARVQGRAGLDEKVARLLCQLLGHEIEGDRDWPPETDYCLWCGELVRDLRPKI